MLLKPRAGLGIQNSGFKFVSKSRNRKFVGADNGVKRFSQKTVDVGSPTEPTLTWPLKNIFLKRVVIDYN